MGSSLIWNSLDPASERRPMVIGTCPSGTGGGAGGAAWAAWIGAAGAVEVACATPCVAPPCGADGAGASALPAS